MSRTEQVQKALLEHSAADIDAYVHPTTFTAALAEVLLVVSSQFAISCPVYEH